MCLAAVIFLSVGVMHMIVDVCGSCWSVVFGGDLNNLYSHSILWLSIVSFYLYEVFDIRVFRAKLLKVYMHFFVCICVCDALMRVCMQWELNSRIYIRIIIIIIIFYHYHQRYYYHCYDYYNHYYFFYHQITNSGILFKTSWILRQDSLWCYIEFFHYQVYLLFVSDSVSTGQNGQK